MSIHTKSSLRVPLIFMKITARIAMPDITLCVVVAVATGAEED